MRILRVESKNKSNGVVMRVQVGKPEFKQLQGSLNNICMFSVDTITEPAKVTKTGARHSHAKWFLLPVKMRMKYKSDGMDFETTRVGDIEYKDKVFFIYMVGRKGFGK